MFRGSMRAAGMKHRMQRQQKFFYLLSDGTLKSKRWWRSCVNDAEVLKKKLE